MDPARGCPRRGSRRLPTSLDIGAYRDKIFAALKAAFYPEHTASSLGAARIALPR